MTCKSCCFDSNVCDAVAQWVVTCKGYCWNSNVYSDVARWEVTRKGCCFNSNLYVNFAEWVETRKGCSLTAMCMMMSQDEWLRSKTAAFTAQPSRVDFPRLQHELSASQFRKIHPPSFEFKCMYSFLVAVGLTTAITFIGENNNV